MLKISGEKGAIVLSICFMTGQKIKFCWAAFSASESLHICIFFFFCRMQLKYKQTFLFCHDRRMSLGSVHSNEPGVLEAPLPALSNYVIYSSQLFKL